MSRTRPRLRIVLIALVTTVGAVAGAAALASCGARSAAGNRLQDPPAGTTFTGHGTDDARVVLYAVGDHLNLGACANKDPQDVTRSWSAPLVAVSATLLDGDAGCGKQVAVSNASGTTVNAIVVGRCSSCTGDDIALSPELFHQLASFGQFDGAISLTWHYLS